jgi:hypothetical protein
VSEALATKAAGAAFEKYRLKKKQRPSGKRKIASRKSRSTRHSPAEAHCLAPKIFRFGLNLHPEPQSAYIS